MFNPIRTILVQLLVIVTSLVSFSALAETVNCKPITNAMVPYTIVPDTTSGSSAVYCLTEDLVTSDPSLGYAAITINANNVVLDLNQHRIGGLRAGIATQAMGIVAANRQNITIKNGTIRGYYFGIFLNDSTTPATTSQGHVIEDMRLDHNTRAAIYLNGKSSAIRRNKIFTTGGSAIQGNYDAYGMMVYGPDNRVIGNDVIDTVAASTAGVPGLLGNAEGIFVANADGSVIAGNRASGFIAQGGADAGAINVQSSNHVLVRNNRMTCNYDPNSCSTSGLALYGLQADIGSASNVVYGGNIAVGFYNNNHTYIGGGLVDAGNNH